MPERRVIFVNRVYWPDESATAQLLADLAPALAQRGWQVHVVAGGLGADAHQGVCVHRTGGNNRVSGWWSRLRSYARFLREARRIVLGLVRPGDVLVVKTDPPLLASWLTAAAARRGAVVCQWLQDIYPEIVSAHKGAWLHWPLAPLRLWRNAAWRRSARVLVVGEDMAATVRRAGVPESHLRHFPNWAPGELDQPPEPHAVLAEKHRWAAPEGLVVAYSGNLGRVHEFTTLLDAANLLRAEPGITFVVIGGGPRLNELQAGAALRGLDNLRFLPATPRARLPAALAAADVHLVTLRAGFERLVYPSKLAGILASGRPAVFVGPPDSALARYLQVRGCGSTVANADAPQLASLLLTLARDPARRVELGAAARRAYESDFRLATAVNHWERLLAELAGERSLPTVAPADSLPTSPA